MLLKKFSERRILGLCQWERAVPMEKSVTIVEIAKECGVSVATVSRVLNGSAPVSEQKRQKIQEAIARHHYTPNAFARGLVSRQSMTLGVLIPDCCAIRLFPPSRPGKSSSGRRPISGCWWKSGWTGC